MLFSHGASLSFAWAGNRSDQVCEGVSRVPLGHMFSCYMWLCINFLAGKSVVYPRPQRQMITEPTFQTYIKENILSGKGVGLRETYLGR